MEPFVLLAFFFPNFIACFASKSEVGVPRPRRGETQLRGPEILGPLRGLGIRSLVSVIRGGFRGLAEVCSFSKERGKKVGHSETPKRPRFPGCPLTGFQPSGSYPQATDNMAGAPENSPL